MTLEKNIAYPMDISLLSRLVQETEYIMQNVKDKKMVIASSALKRAKAVSKIY